MTGPRAAPPDPPADAYAAARSLAALAPAPARFDNVVLGTAGWTDPTLMELTDFYPRGARSGARRLQHYASHFELVEVDATYYSLLPPTTAAGWVAATAPAFVFDVKAHPVFTGHPVDLRRLPRDLRQVAEAAGLGERARPAQLPAELRSAMEARFVDFLEPLRASDRLGCLMLQFPPWFEATRGNGRRLEALAGQLEGVPLAVEFRHPSWLSAERRQRVADHLRALGMAYVVVDEPEARGGGVPPVPLVTSDELAVVRFHGRNQAGWERRGASVQQRFDYLYRPEELRAWVPTVKALAQASRRVHAVFNNCVRDYAVLGAKGLAHLLLSADS